MARIRTIKPDFWTDEKVVELSAFSRLLFIGLWNFADDEGRMVFSEKRIKMQIFPSDNLNISELFGEIRREKLVDIYEVDNIQYLQIVNFDKHQKVDKRTASKLPPKPTNISVLPRITPNHPDGREGNGREEDMEEEGIIPKPLTDENFETFWKKFPNQRKGNREKTYTAWKQAITRSKPETILAGLEAYLRSDQVTGGFAKGAAAWLNDDRWGWDYSYKPNHKTMTPPAKPIMSNVEML